MQEELGELECCESNGVLVWSCPLCQQGQTDRDALALHLTHRHSVLPACLDRLLETAVPLDCAREDNMDDKAQSNMDASCAQQMQVEIPKAPSHPSEADLNTEGPNQAAGNTLALAMELASCHEKEIGGEGARDQEEAEGSLEHNLERTELPDSMNSEKRSSNTAVDEDASVGKSSATVSGDSSLEKFLDPNCPFKCHTCLESFTSKSALSIHYSSPTHLQRIRTVLSKQGGDNDSSTSIQPNLIRPFISSKPYQCAVCRVSYNHAITLESHLKSVLHQTRSRNAGNSATSATGNSGSKATGNCGNGVMATSSTVSSGVSATQTASATAGHCSSQGSLAALAMTTKDGEQIKPHPVFSLLSSPVASAQAVSAFLTLLTSSSHSLSSSLLPSLFTVNASASPATPAPQLIPQQQLLLPLFLNGLQAQNQSPNPESSNPILTQPISVLGLNAAQQALLAQRLSYLQSLGFTVENPAAAQTSAEEKETRDTGEEEMVEEQHSPLPSGKTDEEEDKDGKRSMSEGCEHGVQAGSNLSVDEEVDGKTVSEEFCREIIQPNLNSPVTLNKVPDDSSSPGNVSLPSNTSLSPIHLNLTLSPDTTPQKSHTDTSLSPSSNPSPNHSSRHSPYSASTEDKSHLARPSHLNTIPALNLQDPACRNAHVKPLNTKPGTPTLSEFQYQVLWAFLESRSEEDAASPPQEDCEALGLEVGLEVEEVRRWLWDAREARGRGKLRGTERASCKVVPKDVNPDVADLEPEEGEGVLTIVESGADSPATHSHAMDLSSSGGRGKEQDSENHGDDSDKEGFYTSVVVTDEESQDSSMREEPVSPMAVERWAPLAQKKDNCGGKVLRSSTVFLSDAEDEDDDEEGGTQKIKRKRKREMEIEEADLKRQRQDPDVDLELEAQADPPAPPVSLEQQSLPRISGSNILHSLPLSLSLAPFATQFLGPYVLQLPASAVGLGMNAGEGNRGKIPTFTNPPAITRCSGPFSDPLNAPPPASHTSPSRFLPNGGEYESALDLSIGKNHSSTTSSSSSSSASIKEAIAQRDRLLDGLGFKPTAVGVPGAGGLIVVRVKPEHALAIPPSTNSNTVNISSNNNAKINSMYIRTTEQVGNSMMDRGRDKDREREKEREKDSKSPKVQRYRDMRRSRTIIHTEQLDVLYGCYFKDPNPGKHEFEQIAEWVHLPKKVVQIWFQNMRARERKGEVRFISDGTLAAVGKPLIKFTWPLTLPIFSSNPKSNPSALSSSGVTKFSAASSPTLTHPKTRLELEKLKEEDKEAPLVPRPKPETQTPAAKAKVIPKAKAATAAVPEVVMETQPPLSYSSLKCKVREEEKRREEEEITDEEEEEHVMEKIGPGATNRMIPKQSTSTSKPTALGSQKHNGLNYWSPKGPFKINTLSREQLGLSTARTPVVAAPVPAPAATTSTPPPTTIKSSHVEVSFLHHSTPRRPRTHLTSLQLSILQSCYETCAHPNALECETVGTELGLPLKVVQIWFQNTRAKEKRWRLQQEKQFPGATDSKKAEFRAGSYLQYSALRANRPILPKPVHLTEVEPNTPSVQGQSVGHETLRGRCEVCGVAFESRATGRAHVFSPRHLATLRTTNFGQPPSLINSSSASGSGSGEAALSSSPSPAISTS
ncbi:hypothetical protein SKAU_G00054660 [Synaphobranchus kaupii]|uniref:Zinc finger homeobox protein 2 n=1 Tax=Synaphobranchus kaupii TaxID=118154 RepID=A0A9Q1G4K2_SYNKA|nr:hypothetical protein SKAU_G00054660 [Synaphobranchus kaupii]